MKMIADSLLTPSDEEAVKSYSGPLDELSKVDQFYFTLAQIPLYALAPRVIASALARWLLYLLVTWRLQG